MLRRTFVQSISFAASLLGLKENPPQTNEELVNAMMGPKSTNFSWPDKNLLHKCKKCGFVALHLEDAIHAAYHPFKYGHHCGACGQHFTSDCSHSCSSKQAWQKYYDDCGIPYHEQERLKALGIIQEEDAHHSCNGCSSQISSCSSSSSWEGKYDGSHTSNCGCPTCVSLSYSIKGRNESP